MRASPRIHAEQLRLGIAKLFEEGLSEVVDVPGVVDVPVVWIDSGPRGLWAALRLPVLAIGPAS